jgi:hypothetical protein
VGVIVISPAYKGRRFHAVKLAKKVVELLENDVHALVIDLLPPSRFDPQGLHGAILSHLGSVSHEPPPGRPFTLASYRGGETETFVEPVGLGQSLRDMTLFLEREHSVNVPLERTYQEAYDAMPAYWREVIEGKAPPAP